MSIAEWNSEIEEIKEVCKSMKSKIGKNYLSDAVYKLKKKIDDEQNRIDTQLKVKVINGKEYSLPACIHNGYDLHKYYLKVVGDVLYLIDKRGKLDEDNSYHWWHYAWIPNGNKYTKLLVRTLGGDRFGDRYFAETDHYKHPADRYPYQNRRLAHDNKTYKTHIEYILNELDLLSKSKPR